MLCFKNGTTGVSVSCVVGCYALPLLCLSGLCLNLFSVGVLTSSACRKGPSRSRSRLAVFLVALCVFDSLKLVFSLLIVSSAAAAISLNAAKEPGDEPTFGEAALNRIAVYSVRLFYPFLVATNYACIWTITAIGVQRYFGICHPLSSRGSAALSRHKVVIAAIATAAVLLNVVRYGEVEVWLEPGTGTPRLVPGPFHRSRSWPYLILMDGVLYVALLYLFPLLLLAAMNTRIISVIYESKAHQALLTNQPPSPKSSDRRGSAGSHTFVSRIAAGPAAWRGAEKREFRSAYMIMAIVLLFFCCYTLPVVVRVREILDPSFGNTPTGAVIYELSNLLVNLNSALDPLFYFIFTQGFKDSIFRKRENSEVSSKKRSGYEKVCMKAGVQSLNSEAMRTRLSSTASEDPPSRQTSTTQPPRPHLKAVQEAV